MSRIFLLLTTTTILSMVALSHTAIYFEQIPTSELIKPYCNGTKNLDVIPHDVIPLQPSLIAMFPHDVIPLQSSTQIELLPDTLYCKASTISNHTRNMSSVLGSTANSSMHVAHVANLTLKDCLVLVILITPMFGLLAFTFKFPIIVHQLLLQWTQIQPVSYDIESRAPTNPSERASKAIWDRIAGIDKGKGPCIKQMVMACIEELQPESRLWRIILAYKTPSICFLLNEAFDELKKHPEIYDDPKLYDFATVFLMTLFNRVIFMEIPSDCKVSWLKKCYISNTC